MSELKRCAKCNKLPEDILTLTCKHDLCLDCASERLAYQLNKNISANSIVCEICYERTLIDQRSVSELKRIISSKQSPGKMSRIQKNEKLQRMSSTFSHDKWRNTATNEGTPGRVYNYNSEMGNSTPNRQFSSSKRICTEHPDQEILYFCFNCLCECICPQCIIHGKHREHDVKTIKKAHPIVKTQLETTLGKIQGSIQSLLTRRSEIEQSLRYMGDQNSQAKAQITRAFEEIRVLLAAKEKQILARCDQFRGGSADEAQKAMKALISRIEQLRGRSGTINEHLKKDEMLLLNFYAGKGKSINPQFKEGPLKLSPTLSLSVEKILLAIRQIGGGVNRIPSTAQLVKR